MSDSESRSELVMNLAEEFLQRYRRGEHPPLREYIARHPELAAEIREVFPAMAMMENIVLADESLHADWKEPAPPPEAPKQLGDYRIIREVGRGGMGIVYEAEQVSLGRHVALKVMPLKRLADARQRRRFEREAKAAAKLHHTNIVPVFGVGEHEGLPYYVMQFIQGLGLDSVLNEVRQMQLDKRPTPASSHMSGVASGEVTSSKDVSAAQVARSLIQGKFATTADQPEGAPGGQTIADLNPTPLPESVTSGSSVVLPGQSDSGSAKKLTYWQSVAQIGVQVADALEYAHKQGILHRDIKPSNLLLDLRGTVWVTDLGLAKANDQEDLTHTGDIVGTLRYMPPEAFEGKTDARSDVYALGLTLYELLALRPAFDDKERNQLIKQVTTSEPARLDSFARSVPHDLVTIIHKAIDRDPRQRYASAGEFAADLRRFLDDEPIHARRTSRWERAWRWCRRNPAVASLTAAVAASLLLGTVIAGSFAVQAGNRARDASKAQRDAEAKAEANRKLLSEQYVQNGLALMDKGDLPGAMLWVGAALKVDENDPDRAAMHRLRMSLMLRECPRPDRQWLHPDFVTFAVYSPDGRQVATVCKDKTVRIFEIASGKLLHELSHPDTVGTVEFTGSGNRLLTYCQDPNLADNPPGMMPGMGMMNQSQVLVRVWDVSSGKLLTPALKHLSTPGFPVAINQMGNINARGDRLVLIPNIDEFTVRDVDAGKEIGSKIKLTGMIQGVWLVEDGRHVVTLSGGTFSGQPSQPGMVPSQLEWRLWDPATGEAIKGPILFPGIAQGFMGSIQSVSSDRRHLLLDTGGHACLMEVATGRQIWKETLHSGFVNGMPFSGDNSAVVLSFTSPQGRPMTRVLETTTGKLVGELTFEPAGAMEANFGGDIVMPNIDGRRVARWGAGGSFRLWDVTRGTPISATIRQDGPPFGEFSPDGRRILTLELDGTIRVCDSVTGHLVMPVLRRESSPFPQSKFFSPDGRHVLTFREKSASLWAVTPVAHNAYTVAKPGMAQQVNLSPNGRFVAILESNKATLLDTTTGKSDAIDLETTNAPPQGPTPSYFVTFSPDSQWISIHRNTMMMGGGPGQPPPEIHVLLCETSGRRRRHKLACHTASYCLFSPDSRRLVIMPNLKIWDVETGQPVLDSQSSKDDMFMAGFQSVGSFSVDSKRLVTCFPMTSPGPDFNPMKAAFDPPDLAKLKGWAVFTVWNAQTGQKIVGPLWQEVKRTQMGMQMGMGSPMGMPFIQSALSPDGQSVLILSSDGVAHLWDVASGKPSGEPMRIPVFDGIPEIGIMPAIPMGSFSPDGAKILLTDNRSRALVFDAKTCKLALSLDNVQAANFSPDGGRIVTLNRDMTARIVSATAGVPLTPTMPISNSGVAGMGGGMMGGYGMYGGVYGGMYGGMGMMGGYGMGGGGTAPPMFSRDGRRLFTMTQTMQVAYGTSTGWELRVWDAGTGLPLGPAMTTFMMLSSFPFTDDGKRLLLVNRDQSFEVRDLVGDPRPLDDLDKIAQAFSGRRIDETGSLVPLDADKLATALNELHARPAEEYRRPAMPLDAWQRLELDACMAPLSFGGFPGGGYMPSTGFAITDMNHPSTAHGHLKSLLAANPKDPDLWLWRGDAYLCLGDWDQAAAAYTEAANLGPKQVALFYRAHIHAVRHDYRAALADFSASGPMTSYLEGVRALLLYQQGDVAEYRRVCERLLDQAHKRRMQPSFSVPDMTATRMCTISPHLVKNLHGLVELADIRKTSSPTDCAAVYYRVGRYDDAATLLVPHVTEASADSRAAFFLAMTRHRLGKSPEAKEMLATAIKYAKKNAELRRQLAPSQQASAWQAEVEEQLLQAEAERLILAPTRVGWVESSRFPSLAETGS